MPRLTCYVRGPKEIEAMLFGLARACLVQLRNGNYPLLYKSRVRYKREPIGQEVWQTCKETLAKGHGDCEDLAAWRCAELWLQGEYAARPECYSPRPGLIHCVVRRASGRREDPSKRLGMGGDG
jgi:hypothetical protein